MAVKVIERILFHKQVLDNEDIVDIKIEKVERKEGYEEGIRYSLAYVRNNINLIRLDNHNGEEHHKHVGHKKLPYEFVDEWKLVEDFISELKKIGIQL